MPRGLDPAALALASTGLALLLSRETQLGVTLGHAEITATLEALLDTLEPLED